MRLEQYDPEGAVTAESYGRYYFPTLTPPLFNNRATYRYDLGRNMWALEQLLVFGNVTATIRTTVVKLKSTGGLWVHSPQYPTGEFRHLLDELGTVEHVILPCNAFEHKAPVKAFLQYYPQAQVWITPGQYGPFGSCGTNNNNKKDCQMGYNVDGIPPIGNPQWSSSSSEMMTPSWADEFEVRTLYVDLPQNAGPVSEAAFLHKPTKTLITTDAVIYIPDRDQYPLPPIFSTYFDAPTLAQPGFWPKTVLQAVFLPLRTSSSSNEGGDSYPAYDAIKERLIRAPILRAFSDARAPKEVQSWVQSIVMDDTNMGSFDRIVTSHFASPIQATPQQFANAFQYLNNNNNNKSDDDPPISCEDWKLLDSLNSFIDDNQLGAPVIYDFKSGCKSSSSSTQQ